MLSGDMDTVLDTGREEVKGTSEWLLMKSVLENTSVIFSGVDIVRRVNVCVPIFSRSNDIDCVGERGDT